MVFHHPGPDTMTYQSDSDVDKWEEEYARLQIIPSTTRVEPSKALKLFAEFFNLSRAPLALDAGCGNGRNAIYLASRGCQVVAADFSRYALSRLEQAASRANLIDRITPVHIDLSERLPFQDGYFRICLDSYVSCHFLDDTRRDRYLSEVHRVLSAEGIFYTSLFSLDDDYYATVGRQVSTEPAVVVDPHNCIAKRLYRADEVRRYLQPFFAVDYLVRFEFSDRVIGRPFARVVYAILASKHES